MLGVGVYGLPAEQFIHHDSKHPVVTVLMVLVGL